MTPATGLHIWGRMSSINARKVAWCAQELGLDFQRTEAGGPFGLVQTPEYLALNPNALVPVVQDGGHGRTGPATALRRFFRFPFLV